MGISVCEHHSFVRCFQQHWFYGIKSSGQTQGSKPPRFRRGFAHFKINAHIFNFFYKSIDFKVAVVLTIAFLGAIFYAPNWAPCYIVTEKAQVLTAQSLDMTLDYMSEVTRLHTDISAVVFWQLFQDTGSGLEEKQTNKQPRLVAVGPWDKKAHWKLLWSVKRVKWISEYKLTIFAYFWDFNLITIFLLSVFSVQILPYTPPNSP